MKRHGSMNHIYRLVWSNATNSWVAVAETARGRGKSARRKLVAAALSLTAIAAHAGPTGGQVVTGNGSILQSGATTTVNQSSQNLSLNWNTFNISPQETVNFVQPSASAIAVNRIFDTNGSQILGHLNANGQVYLINPNGILFGQGAQVNVGGLVASTLDTSDAGLSSNLRTFGGSGTGSVTNLGVINAANGGYVALLGNHVSNQGTITAQLGTVALGAGNTATLTFGGNSLVQIQVDQSVLNSLAQNGGLIQADGGRVIMTAGSKDSLLASVVNNTGVIEARTVNNQGGTITLLGGMSAGLVNVGGTLDATAPNGGNGGFIETSATNVKISDQAKVTTVAASGKYGNWLVDPSDFTVAASGGNETGAALASALGSGNVTLLSSSGTAGGSGNMNINDAVTWSANTTLTLTAANNVNVNASITANGATAGIAINPKTGNGSDSANSSGVFSLGNGAAINLPNVSSSSSTALQIGGAPYTVINSLGAAGSVTGTDLQGIAGSLTKNYALGSNINAAATSSWNAGAGFAPLGTASGSPASAVDFTTIFDGLGHTITGLTVNRSASIGGGLFAAVSGTVRNVGMVGGSVVSSGYAGGLVGELNNGTVSNSYATGNVSIGQAQLVGGLVGLMNSGTVSNSYATGNVSATSSTGLSLSVGGLVGGMQGGTVLNSHATGSVSGGEGIGGLVGYMYGNTTNGEISTVTNSYAKGNVSGTYGVGGLVGSNYGFRASNVISNSYATGNVTGLTQASTTPNGIGGFLGHSYGNAGYGGASSVLNSYATGNVTSAASSNGVGGLVGFNAGNYGTGTITNSYSAGSVSSGAGSTHVGGLVGLNSFNNTNIPQTFTGSVTHSFWDKTTSGQAASDGGTGMTTANMQTQANFTSSTAANGSVNPAWDFSGTWVMFTGTYPLLKADMIAATVTANAATSTYSGSAFSGGNGVTVTDTINGLTSTISPSLTGLNYTGNSQGAINAGSAYVITPGGLSSNQQGYYFTYANGNLTINPLALTGSIGTGSSVYGATLTPGTASFTNLVSGDVITPTIGVTTTGLTSTSGHLTAGTHNGIETITGLSGPAAGNYTFAGVTGNYTVTQLALSGSIAAGSSVYGATLAPGSASLSGAISGDVIGTATVTVNTTGLTSTSGHLSGGTHTGIESVSGLSGADAGNYTFATVTGDYTVSPLALTATIASGSSTYGSALTPGALSFTNVVSGDVVTGTAVTVNTTGATSTSGHLVAGTHTGVETVGSALGGADAADYSFTGSTTGNYTVSTLALTGSITAGSSTYGASLTPGASSFTNAVSGDVLGASVTVNTTGLTSGSGHLTAGTHNGIESISGLSGADGGNYTYAGVTGNYTVSPLALTGSITTGSSTYGSSLAAGTASFSNAISGDTLGTATVSVSTTGQTSTSGHLTAGTHTGNETVTALSGSDAGNYTFSGVTGDYTVAPLALSATISAGSSTYGASLAPGSVNFSNAVTGDVVNAGSVTVTTTGQTSTSGNLIAGTHTGAETVGSSLSGSDAGNYTFAGTTGDYTVSKLALTGSIAAGSSTYGATLTPGGAQLHQRGNRRRTRHSNSQRQHYRHHQHERSFDRRQPHRR